MPTVTQNVALSDEERRQVLDTAARFVRTAVRREHTVESFELVSARVRSGYTRRQWANGQHPGPAVPRRRRALEAGLHLRGRGRLSVYVIPRPGEQLSPMVFLLSLTRAPSGEWVVDSWVPRAARARSPRPPAQSWSSRPDPVAVVGTNTTASSARGPDVGLLARRARALLLSGLRFGLLPHGPRAARQRERRAGLPRELELEAVVGELEAVLRAAARRAGASAAAAARAARCAASASSSDR